MDKPRAGRPCTINDELIAALWRDIQRAPSNHGLEGKNWTGVLLRQWLQQRYEAHLSLRQSQRLLKRIRSEGEAIQPQQLGSEPPHRAEEALAAAS